MRGGTYPKRIRVSPRSTATKATMEGIVSEAHPRNFTKNVTVDATGSLVLVPDKPNFTFLSERRCFKRDLF